MLQKYAVVVIFILLNSYVFQRDFKVMFRSMLVIMHE